jgi:hypothetical protein
MSKKKKKKKFKPSFVPQSTAQKIAQPVAPITAEISTPSSPLTKPTSTGAITSSGSRQETANFAAYDAHQAEYDNINKDLIKVMLVNGLLFGAIVLVYFLNNRNHFLDNLYNWIF